MNILMDVLNIVAIVDYKIMERFDELYNPKYLMISKNDGKFNRRMSLIKDQMIGLYAFNN